jgi:hypothetical protein
VSPWQFTPAVQNVLCRAAKLATDEQDEYIRLAHLERALKAISTVPKVLRKRRGFTCPQCNRWFGWSKNFRKHTETCLSSKQGSEVIS